MAKPATRWPCSTSAAWVPRCQQRAFTRGLGLGGRGHRYALAARPLPPCPTRNAS
ncbi:MAG: hypothetical protein WKG07_21600 [Hymenobacter sp.]